MKHQFDQYGEKILSLKSDRLYYFFILSSSLSKIEKIFKFLAKKVILLRLSKNIKKCMV